MSLLLLGFTTWLKYLGVAEKAPVDNMKQDGK